MVVIDVSKLEMHSPAFRNILRSDQVNAAIRSTGRTIANTAKLKGTKTSVVPSTGFKDHRQIGFVGGNYKVKPEKVESTKKQLKNAMTKHVHRSFD